MSRDLDDVITLMKATNTELIPIFVAKDLHAVPSVGFDHIDCTRLLKDIARLQSQVCMLQEKFVTMDTFEQLKQNVEHMKHASLIESVPSLYVNKRRGACLQDSYELNSGPIGLQYVPIKTAQTLMFETNRHNMHNRSTTSDNSGDKSVPFQRTELSETASSRRVEAPTEISCVLMSCASDGDQPVCGASVTGTTDQAKADTEATESIVIPNSELSSADALAVAALVDDSFLISNSVNKTAVSVTYAETQRSILRESHGSVLVSNCAVIPEEDSEWQVVKSKSAKRYKLLGQKGRASSPNGKFKAADVKVPLFISNVSTETSEQDIISYIENKAKVVVSLKKIKMKTDRKYNAYKLFVSKTKLDIFLNNEFWPDGITFRRFVHFMYSPSQEGRNLRKS